MSRDQRTHQDHHQEAANHHDQAAFNHREAIKHYEGGDDTAANKYARLASEHLRQATEHDKQASEKIRQQVWGKTLRLAGATLSSKLSLIERRFWPIPAYQQSTPDANSQRMSAPMYPEAKRQHF